MGEITPRCAIGRFGEAVSHRLQWNHQSHSCSSLGKAHAYVFQRTCRRTKTVSQLSIHDKKKAIVDFQCPKSETCGIVDKTLSLLSQQ